MKFLNAAAALVALAAIGAQPASAVEVRKAIEIKAAPAAVWAKIGEWCAIKDWHPAIAKCEPGKRGMRTLTLKDGGKIVEKITKTGKNTYSYDIVEGPLPVKNYSATLTAKADSLGTTDLVWTAKFDPAKGKTAAEAEAVIAGIFDAGLANIKSNVKFDPAAPSAAVAGTAAVVAATAAVSEAAKAAAARDEARLKAREERRRRFAAAKIAAMEKYARAKTVIAEKAKAAADAAKAAYEKAKAALELPAAAPKKP